MPSDFNYGHLFEIIFTVLREKKEFVASCECANCKYMKVVKVYFKLLKACADNDDKVKYNKIICRFIEREEEWLVHSFIHAVLYNVDEDGMMDMVFDEKETDSNDLYLTKCNILMSVKNFKKMYQREYS